MRQRVGYDASELTSMWLWLWRASAHETRTVRADVVNTMSYDDASACRKIRTDMTRPYDYALRTFDFGRSYKMLGSVIWTVQLSIAVRWTMNRCKNCRVACDGTYCRLCYDLRECESCHRRLTPRLFTIRDSVCDTCVRKSQTVRSALNGIVQEHEIPISGNDGDLHVFLDEHERNVVSILEQAINQHG